MKRIFKASFIAVTALLAAGAVTLPAAARGIAAYPGGRAAFPVDASCFAEQWGAARNDCSSTRSYAISLPVDSAGAKNVWVSAYGATSSNNVACRAIAESADLTYTWATPFKYLSSFGTPEQMSLYVGNVPSYGVLYVYCNIDPGGRVHSVTFE